MFLNLLVLVPLFFAVINIDVAVASTNIITITTATIATNYNNKNNNTLLILLLGDCHNYYDKCRIYSNLRRTFPLSKIETI